MFYEREKSTHKKQSSHLLLELWVLASCWTFIPQKFRVRLICCSFLVGVCLLLCKQISKLIIAGKGVSRCNVLITCSFHFICSLTSFEGGGGGSFFPESVEFTSRMHCVLRESCEMKTHFREL